MKMKWYEKPWLNGAVVLLVMILTGLLIIKTQSLALLFKLAANLKAEFLFLAIGSIVLFCTFEGWMLHVLISSKGKGHSKLIAIKSMILGQYYSLITPFASGGQPMQLMAMMQDGLSASHATAVLVNKFLYFQIGVTVYAAILSVFNWAIVWQAIQMSYGMMALGLIVNFFGLGIMLAMIFMPRAVKRFLYFFSRSIKKLGYVKRHQVKLDKVHSLERKWLKGVDHFTTSIRDMLMHPIVMMKMLILTWVQLTAYFSLAYWVYRAFGFREYSFTSMIALQAVLYLSISLLPAPGSAGVAEGGFFIFFGSVFTAGTLAGAMLLWRGISYYLTLAITGLATLVISIINWSKTMRFERSLNRN